MKKIYLVVALFSATLIASAQCNPESFDWMGADFGIDPDAGQGDTFDTGELGVAYEDVIFLNIPSDANQINTELPSLPIDSVLLDNISFLQDGNIFSLEDMGLSLTCNNLDVITTECGFMGGQLGCSILSGTPLLAGEFLTSVNVLVYVTVANQPFGPLYRC